MLNRLLRLSHVLADRSLQGSSLLALGLGLILAVPSVEARSAASPLKLGLDHATDPADALARNFTVRQSGGQQQPLQLLCQEQGGKQELHQRKLGAMAEQQVTLRGFKAATTYQCWAETLATQYRVRTPSVSFITAPLPIDLKVPTITKTTNDVARTGYMLYNYATLQRFWTIKNRYLVILDPEGNVRWYYKGEGGGDVDVSWLGNDRVLMGGFHDYSIEATIVGLDKQTYFKDAMEVTAQYEQADSANHDAGISEDGQSVFTFAYLNNGTYTSFLIRQLDITTGKVIWNWSGIEDGAELGQIPAGSSSDTDPHHANAIDDQWEDGRLYLYVSMRNQNQMMKLDYETGEVIWKLGIGGDFTLLEKDGTPATDDRWFFNNHDAKMYGPNLFAVHDNGTERANYGGTNYSRGLQLELDQEAMTARIKFEYTEPNWVEPIWSGYDVYPDGRSLVAIGHCWLCTSQKVASIIELDPAGQVLWRADMTNEKEHLYRAERIDGCDIFNNTRYCPTGRQN